MHDELRRRPFALAVPLVLLTATVASAADPADAQRRAPRVTAVRAAADAHVTSTARASNFGSYRNLVVDARPTTRTYLRFSVNLRRGPGRVRRVSLLVYSRTRSRIGFEVRTVTEAWREGAITFGNAPRFSSRFISSGPLRARAWKAVDITPFLEDRDKTIGLVLTTVGRQRIELASRESGTTGPRLVLERDVDEGPLLPPPGPPPAGAAP